jgi:hypothetical protein
MGLGQAQAPRREKEEDSCRQKTLSLGEALLVPKHGTGSESPLRNHTERLACFSVCLGG